MYHKSLDETQKQSQNLTSRLTILIQKSATSNELQGPYKQLRWASNDKPIVPTIILPTRDLKSINKYEFQTLYPTRISPRKQVHTNGAG